MPPARLGFQGQAALHRVSLARVLAAPATARPRRFEQAAAEAAAVADRLGAAVRFHRRSCCVSRAPLTTPDLLVENVRWYAGRAAATTSASRIELASVLGDADALDALLGGARGGRHRVHDRRARRARPDGGRAGDLETRPPG